MVDKIKKDAFMVMNNDEPETWPKYFIAMKHPVVEVTMFFRQEGPDVVCYIVQQYEILGKVRTKRRSPGRTIDLFAKEGRFKEFIDEFSTVIALIDPRPPECIEKDLRGMNLKEIMEWMKDSGLFNSRKYVKVPIDGVKDE